MEHARQLHCPPTNSDAARQFASLIHIRTIAEEFAGRGRPDQGLAPDHGERVSAAYYAALPVAQKRFDALVAEASAWASAAAQVLMGSSPERTSPAAAAHLADELARAQQEMERLLGLA